MKFKLKDPGSAITHGIALLLAAVGAVPLIIKAARSYDVLHIVALSIFILTMVLLYAASTIYHSVDSTEKVNRRLTIQATEEGYSFIFYDSDLHEIQGGDYDNPDASIQEAAYEILKSERMDDLECVKVDYKEFEEMTIQHSKDLLQEGELRATSEIGRNELALNSLSRAEVERGVLYHAQAVLEAVSYTHLTLPTT